MCDCSDLRRVTIITNQLTENDLKKILDDLIELIQSRKGEDLLVVDVNEITSIADYIVIVTANSTVHANSLATYVMEFFEEKGLKNLYKRRPDLKNPWILIDSGEVIVNVFMREEREFYNLEKLYFKGKIIYKSGLDSI